MGRGRCCSSRYNAHLPNMSLLPGTRVGPYEIVAAVGAGGMGEVYRARDTRLKRDVAIKALPETFASDRECLARFQREAEVLASPAHARLLRGRGYERISSLRIRMRYPCSVLISRPVIASYGHTCSPKNLPRAANLLPVAIAPDRRALAYTYIRDTHDLYLVEWT